MAEHRRHRGMTLLEVVLTAALVLGVFALAAPSFGGAGERDATAARATLSGALDAQVALSSRHGAFTSDPATVADLVPRTTVVVAPAGSNAPDTVSVAVSGDTVGLAVYDGTSCWLASATTGPGGQLYAVREGAGTCSGTVALTVDLDPDQPGKGKDPTEPIEL